MKKRRVRIVVELDLDPVPGWNHDPQDYADRLRGRLNAEIPWYRPTVSAAAVLPLLVDSTYWTCPDRIGGGPCQYDIAVDHACDTCIHCGDPNERK